MPKIAVIGTTTFGITLGILLARKGLNVSLWARTEDEAAHLNNNGPHPNYFPDMKIPSKLEFTSDIEKTMSNAKGVLMVVPSQTMRHNICLVKEHLTKSTLIISAAKGLEIGSNKRMSQVISEEIDLQLHPNIAVLSGPNLQREILRGSPAATVVAASDEAIARKAQRLLDAPNFCVYTNTDVIGVEMGGALKNIIALGAGMIDGLGYGDNTKAAFITRGLTEITALGVALGASPLTFSGLAGLGDVIATCASPLSRNHYVGEELTKGRTLENILSEMTSVVEGVTTTMAVWTLARKMELEMPITEKVYQVLYEGLSPKQAAIDLMQAKTKHELKGRKWNLFSLFNRRKQS